MAYGKSDMGDEDLYGSDADAPSGQPETPPKEGGDDEEHSDADEAILPKSILAGKHFDVGDEVVLKITAIHDDRISVKYAPSKEEGEGEEGGESGEMAGADQAPMPSATAGGGESMYD